VNRGILTFKELADFLVDIKNPLRLTGGRVIANVRVGVLEKFIVQYSKGLPLPKPKIDFQALGRLLQLNQAAIRGYMEDRIVDLHTDLQLILKSHVSALQEEFGIIQGYGLLPEYMIESLFFPGLKYIRPVKLVDLDTLSFEELCARVDKLESIYRDFTFYKLSVNRKLQLEDSFKLLRLIDKSRKKGSLSFEYTKLI
jgi:hypothetical protein